jgi:hypothetical protein
MFRKQLPDMQGPADAHGYGNQNKSPYLPIQEQGFSDKQNSKNSVAA